MTSAKSKFKFTRGSVDAAKCPPDKGQAIFRDTEEPGLSLRVTANGARSFIFESKLGRQTVRMTIGPASMQIRGAKDRNGRPVTHGADIEAKRLAALVAQGIDPRAEKAASIARHAADRQNAKAERAKLELSGLDAWAVYCDDRRNRWGNRHYADHLGMAAPGGIKRKRSREKVTKPGPLHSLLVRPLAAIDESTIETWVVNETKSRPVRAALAFRLLRGFINWCGEYPEYKSIVQTDAHKAKRVREKLATPVAKNDALQREQLGAWFAEVRKTRPVTAAYLQALLLTGARREELLSLRWSDVDFKWKALRIRDKVDGERTIPLTPYVSALLGDLRARNETPPDPPRRLRISVDSSIPPLAKWRPSPWVFASTSARSGRLQEPRIAHNQALAAAGVPHLTLHGLRRSFGTLAEWVEVPVGVVAQIQGHKPSAIAEKHYRVRPLDLLRRWHERIEAWVLTEAGIETTKLDTSAMPALRVVVGSAGHDRR